MRTLKAVKKPEPEWFTKETDRTFLKDVLRMRWRRNLSWSDLIRGCGATETVIVTAMVTVTATGMATEMVMATVTVMAIAMEKEFVIISREGTFLPNGDKIATYIILNDNMLPYVEFQILPE